MHELTGNVWDYLDSAVVVITTNCQVDHRGHAVLGRGCARQAQEYFPDLAERLGRLLLEQGVRVHELGGGLVSFPIEETAWSTPDLRLIRRSAAQLRELADRRGWEKVVVPRPGCGGGGLEWKEVKPVLADLLDERFYVITAG